MSYLIIFIAIYPSPLTCVYYLTIKLIAHFRIIEAKKQRNEIIKIQYFRSVIKMYNKLH